MNGGNSKLIVILVIIVKYNIVAFIYKVIHNFTINYVGTYLYSRSS